MTFPQQAPFKSYNAAAVPGDIAFDSPLRSKSYNLYSAGTPNTVGNVFTIVNGGNPNTTLGSPNAGTAQVGGSGLFAGILINSKQYASYGTVGQPFAPTLNLPDYTEGELCTMGQVWVSINNQPSIGDAVTFNPANGAISSIPPTVHFVGSSATTTLTVASISSGRIYVGMKVEGATVVPGTIVTAFGSGVGGTGTYTVNQSQTVTSTTLTDTANSVVPNAVVSYFDIVQPGLAVITLTN